MKTDKAKEDSLPEATFKELVRDYFRACEWRASAKDNKSEIEAINYQTKIKQEIMRELESKEDNKAFGEQDLREAFETGNQLGWCKIPKTFEQWISDRKTK